MGFLREAISLSIFPIVQEYGKPVSVAISCPSIPAGVPFEIQLMYYDTGWKQWTPWTLWKSGKFESLPVIFEFTPDIVTQWNFMASARTIFGEIVISPIVTLTCVPASVYYLCPYCNLSFLTQAELDAHIAEDHSDKPPVFECPICHLTFATQALLDEHMKTHEIPPPPDGNGGSMLIPVIVAVVFILFALLLTFGGGKKK